MVQLTELQIIDMAENICNMKKEESDWILKLDIVEKGDKLQVICLEELVPKISLVLGMV